MIKKKMIKNKYSKFFAILKRQEERINELETQLYILKKSLKKDLEAGWYWVKITPDSRWTIFYHTGISWIGFSGEPYEVSTKIKNPGELK